VKLRWPAAFSFTVLLCWVIALAWADLRPIVITALAWMFGAIAVILSACLCALAVGFTAYRLKAARADASIAESAAVFASDAASAVQPLETSQANLWDKGYCDLAWLGFTIGSMSLARMRPYFRENAERLWKHMVDELKRSGWAAVKTAYTAGGRPYKVTVFVGSYRLFFRKVMGGEIDLRPHPRLAPPVISARYAQPETTGTTETMEIREVGD
jgi:hypothetical protein